MQDFHPSIIFPLLMSSSAKLIPMDDGLMAIFFSSLNVPGLERFAELQRDFSWQTLRSLQMANSGGGRPAPVLP
jgi:hypothetical protein